MRLSVCLAGSCSRCVPVHVHLRLESHSGICTPPLPASASSRPCPADPCGFAWAPFWMALVAQCCLLFRARGAPPGCWGPSLEPSLLLSPLFMLPTNPKLLESTESERRGAWAPFWHVHKRLLINSSFTPFNFYIKKQLPTCLVFSR